MSKAAILVRRPEPFKQTFHYPFNRGFIRNLASVDQVVSEEARKTIFNFEILVVFGQGRGITLTFDTHLAEFIHSFS